MTEEITASSAVGFFFTRIWKTQELLVLNLNICSPCDNIRGEAHHKRADERADLLGGPQPPPPLLIQAFLSHTVKGHRYHYLPGRDDRRHSRIMKQSTHNPPEANKNRACLSANSPCGNINYGNGVYFKVGVLDRMDNKWVKSQRMAHWCWACTEELNYM